MTVPEIISKLRFCGAIEFGSRALNVNTNKSDYDFAILRSNYEELFKGENLPEFPLDNYFRVLPAYGRNTLLPNFQIMEKTSFLGPFARDFNALDLLIIEHQEHLNMINNAVKALHKCPKQDLCIKEFRIELYEKELEHQGFIRSKQC